MRKLYEEVYPAQYVAKGLMDVSDPSVRDNINTLLTGVLMSCTLTPYIALEKVRKTLSYFHIHISAVPFMEGDRGFHVFPVNQFGLRYGMKDNGQVVNFSTVEKDLTHGAHREGENFNSVETPETKVTDEKYHIYFEYKMNDKGLFDIFSEIVTDDELQDLLDDAEDDINDDGAEDDRDDRLNEAKSPEALDRKATRQAVIGKVLSAVGAKRTGNRMKMKAHLTSKKADNADDEQEEKLYKEAVMPKIKRFVRKASGKQSKEMATKLDKALDDRQIKTLGHKVNMDNPSDREKLRKDKRYGELNRRYISAKYGNDEPGYRKLTSRYMRGDKKKIDEAKNIATKVLKELRMLNPDGSTASIDSGIGRSNKYNIIKPVQREPAKVEPVSLIGARGPMNPKGIDVDKPPSNSSYNKSWDSNPAFQKSGGDGPSAGTDPFKGVTPNRAGTTSSLSPGSTPMQDPNKLADVKKSFTMQETSHESVNHVRRLAMKKKK